MAWIDDLLKQDEVNDAREKVYIREHLEGEQNARLSDDDLQFMLDAKCSTKSQIRMAR